jgi:hypothetical protein
MPFGSLTGAAILGGSSILGGLLGADAASRAADTSAAASRYAADIQKQMFDTTNAQQAPYREAGYSALSDIGNLKSYLTHQFTPEDFAAGVDPGYAFRLQQGEMANQRAANVAGGALSGNTLAGLNAYNSGMASQEFQNAFNRYQTQRGNIYNTLASIAGLGQTSLGQTTQAGTQAAANQGAAIVGAGQAQAAGTVGAANALTGGIQGASNAYYLNKMFGGGGDAGSTYTPLSYLGNNPTNYDLTSGQNIGGLGFKPA